MARPVSEIIADIEDFKSANGNWSGLDALREELSQSGSAALGIDTMLRIFERYPAEDGFGVFWSLVHSLESLPGYESRLIESVRRAPCEFTLLKVNRLLNAGREEAGGVCLLSLLEFVAQNSNALPEIRQAAQEILDRNKP